MTRLLAMLLLACSGNALALTADAREFLRIVRELEPVHCQKRHLRREIALAEVQGHSSAALKARFAALDRDPKTAKLEQRLAELAPRVTKSPDPEDLEAISKQQREAFYRCE